MTNPAWREDVMPAPDAFRAVFSATAMAEQMLSLYRDLTDRISNP